jgi:hypothetical protein
MYLGLVATGCGGGPKLNIDFRLLVDKTGAVCGEALDGRIISCWYLDDVVYLALTGRTSGRLHVCDRISSGNWLMLSSFEVRVNL